MRLISFKNERIYYRGDLFTVILGSNSYHKFLCEISLDALRYIPGRRVTWVRPECSGYLRKIK